MADPVTGLSFTLQQLRCMLDAMKAYQRMNNDLTMASTIASVQATIVANMSATVPVAGYASALGNSVGGVTGSAN